MTTDPRAACAGRPQLWESTDQSDHQEAKAICDNECPVRAWCTKQLNDTLSSVHGSGVRGTWAGQFFGKHKGRLKGKCPKCHAQSGNQCVSPSGKKISEPHQARGLGLPKCPTCRRTFMPDRAHYRYCSDACSDEGRRESHRRHEQRRTRAA